MKITTSNAKKSGGLSKIKFVSCDRLTTQVIELKMSSVKKTVIRNPCLLEELCKVAEIVNTKNCKNEMSRIFAACKARVDVIRYFNNLGYSEWEAKSNAMKVS